jgi:hypothetical protein
MINVESRGSRTSIVRRLFRAEDKVVCFTLGCAAPKSREGLWIAKLTVVPLTIFVRDGVMESTRTIKANRGSPSTGITVPE